MNDDRYVAAIEISSSKIIAAVGRMYADGRLEVIAVDQERGVDSVRYGFIQNLEETSTRIMRVIDRLQRKPSVAPRIITGLYVGLSGRSLRNIRTEVSISLPDETEITDDILKRLREQALATAIDSSLEVVDAIPRTYYVGKSETHSPKGAIGNGIRAVFDLIVCRPEMRRNLTRTISDKVDIDVKGYVVTALSTAQVILTSEEKRLGCMLVDMGAETTSVSIYKDGSLRYFATLPLGGRNITRDIVTLSVLEERAEEIKMSMANAMNREVSSFNINGVKMTEVNSLTVARAEEIVANIVEQVKYAGMKDSDLPAGIICIGGGMRLNGMIDLLSRQTGLRVNRGKLPGYVTIDDSKTSASELLQVASILYSGATASADDECLEMPGANELPVTGEGNEDDPEETPRERVEPSGGRRNRLWQKFHDRVANIFKTPGEDDSDLIDE